MTETFDIVLTKMPPSMNKRLHWADRARQTQTARAVSFMQARSAFNLKQVDQWPKPGPRTVAIEVVRGIGGGRVQDPDNCVTSCKPIVDGLVDAGWLRDDTSEWLTDLRVNQTRDAKRRGVVVRVTVSDREVHREPI